MAKEKKSTSKKPTVKELEKQVEELKNLNLRLNADFENYRKRKENEIIEARDRAIISFVEDILPSIDNFEMSLKMTDNKEMFVKGVEMIHKGLIDTLKEHNFEHFEGNLGEEFNPNLHDPLLIENKEQKPGSIVQTIKKGVKHKDKIVRPAKVEVVKE